MSIAFKIKKGNLLPALAITLSSDTTFDLADASSVAFIYRARGATERNSITAAVTDAPGKVIRVDWDAGAVDTVGIFEFHVEATFTSGVMSFPSTGFSLFQVTPTIEAP